MANKFTACDCGKCQWDENRRHICCKNFIRPMYRGTFNVACVTDHKDFSKLCLNNEEIKTVLNKTTANKSDQEMNQKCRYIAYRHFCKWTSGTLGQKGKTDIIPECVHVAIDNRFPL